MPSGEAFVAMDRLLDEARMGPMYLRQPAIAEMVVEAFFFGAVTLGRYELHAFVVMPNHVHLLLTAGVRPAMVTKSLKGITARRANETLGRTGETFWQAESYDHVVRNDREFGKIKNYIEANPVRAGLVRCAEDYRWSSACATWRSLADLEVCPTKAFAVSRRSAGR